MGLNEFLAFCSCESNIYINIAVEKISLSIEKFIKTHPANWQSYSVICVRADDSDLIIEVKKYF